MNDINSVNLIGRLVRDAELSYTKGGSAICNLSIASNRTKKNGEQWINEVSYFDIVFYGKQAEGLKPYLLKGKQIAVSGQLHQDRWEKDGQKFSKIRIVADNVELLGGGDRQNSSSYTQTPQEQMRDPFPAQPPAQEEFFEGDFPEDIPF